MPLVQVKVLEGVFSASQKADIVRKLTDTMVAIEGENLRPVTWVLSGCARVVGHGSRERNGRRQLRPVK